MIRFFSLPYDSGSKGLRMGAGPSRILQTLGARGEEIAPASEWRAEIKTSFELYRALADAVHECVQLGDFPVVLSGNCGAALGAAAGIGTSDLATLWFDAHGDYNTPDTTDSGFLDGMAMSILAGRCWKGLASTIPRFAPIPPRRLMHAGARAYSPGERDALLYDGVWLVEALNLRETTVAPMLDAMRGEASKLLVHLDVDAIDPRFGRANHYAVDGGLSRDDILRMIELASQRFTIAGLVIASYDPTCDDEGTIAEIAARVIETVTSDVEA
ncbi:MAG TPA: arginase family protein [Thermoanaerobaculia bacterium]|nr:arginase family protein [Thermoanaerobaculia bacterium]